VQKNKNNYCIKTTDLPSYLAATVFMLCLCANAYYIIFDFQVSSYQINKISPNSRYLAEASRFNDIQYLDLEFESCDKQYTVCNRTTAAKKKPYNVGGQITLVSMQDYSMVDGAYPYKTVDFLKTAALSMTRKRAEQERRFGRQNMVN